MQGGDSHVTNVSHQVCAYENLTTGCYLHSAVYLSWTLYLISLMRSQKSVEPGYELRCLHLFPLSLPPSPSFRTRLAVLLFMMSTAFFMF